MPARIDHGLIESNSSLLLIVNLSAGMAFRHQIRPEVRGLIDPLIARKAAAACIMPGIDGSGATGGVATRVLMTLDRPRDQHMKRMC